MKLQQSSLYSQYIQALKWNVATVDGVHIFIRRFPVIGGLAKIQRSTTLPNIKKLLPILKKYHVRTLAVEPECTVDQTRFSSWCRSMSRYVRLNRTPFLPTKTLLVDLAPPEEAIFKAFSEAKRRAVRRALKNNLQISESTNMKELITVKNKSAGLFGFITTSGIDKLWDVFAPNHAAILLAYKRVIPGLTRNPAFQKTGSRLGGRDDNNVVAGVLLLFWKQTAYYWIAAATKEGKKLFAPTLLIWEALKLSKKRGCNEFDFVGVWDERQPHKFSDWKGFTKFKEGFGGTSRYYPVR